MGTVWGPNLVTDNLVFCLDPANTLCYSGSGNTLNDLSGNDYHATKTSNISISNGWMDWGSSNNAEYVSIPKEALDGLSSWTLEFSLYITSITSGINTLISCGAANNFLWYFPDHTYVQVQNTATVTFTYATSTATNFLMTFTGTGGSSGTCTVYKNGVLGSALTGCNTAISVAGTFSEITLGQEYDNNATGGFSNSQAWLGKMGIVKFYNRVLTASEILQNFEAHKGRYGL